MSLFANVPCWLREIPEHLKTQAVCDEAVRRVPYSLLYIPNHFKTQEICEEAMHVRPATFFLTPDRFKTQEMYIRAVKVEPRDVYDAPNHFKTQEMCDKAVRDYLFSLRFVPDWFVTFKKLNLWYDDNYVYNDNEMIKWYERYKRRKAQKASIKEELLPITLHPSRWWDWCMSEDEKEETEKLWT